MSFMENMRVILLIFGAVMIIMSLCWCFKKRKRKIVEDQGVVYVLPNTTEAVPCAPVQYPYSLAPPPGHTSYFAPQVPITTAPPPYSAVIQQSPAAGQIYTPR
ncbi:uncharacterized protein [Periplaneta americana]|uniref:uncharacterized protein n=1 Tax=Periplaneta americana TaxID=6978 RepID=UPI0037E7C1B4